MVDNNYNPNSSTPSEPHKTEISVNQSTFEAKNIDVNVEKAEKINENNINSTPNRSDFNQDMLEKSKLKNSDKFW